MPGSTRRAKKPVNAGLLDKEPAPSHQAFADFIASTTGHLVPVGDVALVQRLYPVYLKSPAVVKAKQAEKEAREAEARAKAEEKARKNRERLAALEEQAARLRKELGIENDDVVASVLSLVPDAEESDDSEAEEASTEEPTTLVLAESEDDFVEADSEDDESEDDDLWEDDDEEVEDF